MLAVGMFITAKQVQINASYFANDSSSFQAIPAVFKQLDHKLYQAYRSEQNIPCYVMNCMYALLLTYSDSILVICLAVMLWFQS